MLDPPMQPESGALPVLSCAMENGYVASATHDGAVRIWGCEDLFAKALKVCVHELLHCVHCQLHD